MKSATRGNKTCTHHHEKTGSVGYITDEFRCDAGYARSMIASHANDSTTADKTAVLKLLQFLKNTSDRTLLLGGRDKTVNMFAFTDGANELQDPNHGMLCHAIFLSRDSGAIVCKTAKSKNVAISSTDPEIRSIHTAMVDIICSAHSSRSSLTPKRSPQPSTQTLSPPLTSVTRLTPTAQASIWPA